MSFVWNIPSIPYSQQKLLCYGYINRNYKGYISADIMKLFTRFYSPTFYSLNDIKNAQHFRKYVSPIFSINPVHIRSINFCSLHSARFLTSPSLSIYTNLLSKDLLSNVLLSICC
eukprot:326690_1